MTVIVEAREDFTLEAYRRVSVDGEDVVIGPAALRVIDEARAGFEDLLGSNRGGFIYGVTTRPGVEVGTTIPPEEQRDYALRFRGVGRGFGRDYLDERVVRGIVFARLADFVGGHAKVRPQVAQRVAALLNGPLPRVPLDGQGGAGEILPLMHVMAAVDGDLVEGEGMALLNGSPCATALAADVALHAGHRLSLAEAIFALSIEAYRAPLDAYDEALDDLWGDEAETAVLRHLRGHLSGAVPSGRLAHQAPVSYRILPQILGQAQRAVGAVVRAATAALGSVTENPVYVPADDRYPSGRVLSNGGFHNGAAAPAMDWLTAAGADLALVAQRQVIAMHSPTSGLPHLLSPAGFVGGASWSRRPGRWPRPRCCRPPSTTPRTTSPRPASALTAASAGPPNAWTACSPSWPWSPARHCSSPVVSRPRPWPPCWTASGRCSRRSRPTGRTRERRPDNWLASWAGPP